MNSVEPLTHIGAYHSKGDRAAYDIIELQK